MLITSESKTPGQIAVVIPICSVFFYSDVIFEIWKKNRTIDYNFNANVHLDSKHFGMYFNRSFDIIWLKFSINQHKKMKLHLLVWCQKNSYKVGKESFFFSISCLTYYCCSVTWSFQLPNFFFSVLQFSSSIFLTLLSVGCYIHFCLSPDLCT